METNILLTEKLIKWYERNARVLPWRTDVSPYHVWLSEIMLQQTRVETVIGYYNRFLDALPDVFSLAAAPEDQLLKLWEGLGYYSRVRNMQKAASIVVEKQGGVFPDSYATLKELPGIGEYTAAAIASIAFGEATPAVDGNLLRIFTRMMAFDVDGKSESAKQHARLFFEPLMGERVQTEQTKAALISIAAKTNTPVNLSGTLNQALMDLGAAICLGNHAPKCDACPWREHCEAHRQGRESDYPVKASSKPRAEEDRTVLVILYDGKIAIRKRPDRGLLAGLYELPNKKGMHDEAEAIRFAKELGFSPLRIRRLPSAKHIFTHREWHMTGYEVRADELTPYESSEKLPSPLLLLRPDEIQNSYSIPSAFAAYLGPYLKFKG
ncbi:MAG: A/G-specific adenine glycosylase [Clostridia bacterium]|nr:A/G-specific adenine glycosylase [Clostridia bacterium]